MLTITPIASGSSGNAYLVDDGGGAPLLLEAGIAWREIQRGTGFRTAQLAACLISHEHGDHARAVRDALRAGVDCYLSAPTAQALGLQGDHRLHALTGETVSIGRWRVRDFPVPHDAAAPVGFLVLSPAGDKLLYLTDAAYCPHRFSGLTHIMLEANYSLELLRQQVRAGEVDSEQKKRIMRNHMSIEQACALLRANDLSALQEVWLLHLSARNANAEQFRRAVQGACGRPVYIAPERR